MVIPPPPTEGLGSKFTAGASKLIRCELDVPADAPLTVVAEPFKREEKILAEASIGIENAKDAPHRASIIIANFFAFKEGSVVGCFKISLLGPRPAVSAIKWLC